MNGKIIHNLKEYNQKLVWVEFENADTVSCANSNAYGLSGDEAQTYLSGLYRVDGHFLVSQKDTSLSFHEFTPHILAIYEWQE